MPVAEPSTFHDADGVPSITHLGAKDCVTGSCHLVQAQGLAHRRCTLLVDCGTAQGDDPCAPLEMFPVAPGDIDYLVLTHAHIDHIGRVPELIEAGFAGEILCSQATRALLLPMLRDAMSFSGRSDQTIALLEEKIAKLSKGVALYREIRLVDGITCKLFNAGHILGSCFVLLSFAQSHGTAYRVIFSGDLGCSDTPILPDPDPPESCDLLVLESTYGDRIHPDRARRTEQLAALLRNALADGGIVYIPAFALGRTQEILYELDRIGLKVPVFVDSPLGLEITRIYSQLQEFWDDEAKKRLRAGDHPFDFKGLYASATSRDHRQLLNVSGPAIIIAGSGMCSGGRIVDHLRKGLQDKNNDVVFVGYQASGTMGRQLVEGKIPARARIHLLNGFSAHADQQMLVNWVRAMPEAPKEIRLVHGEEKARQDLRAALHAE